MKRSLILILFLLFTTCAFAQQFAFDLWHEGKIILDSGDTLKGSIKYNLQSDLLQFQENKRNQSFSARKVLFFEIFDGTVKQYRQFYSMPYGVSENYKAPVFFELLAEGKITLMCRETVEYRTYSPSFYYYGTNTRLVLVYKYFLLQENGDITEFIRKSKDWPELMGNQAQSVEQYAKTNRLEFDNRYDLVKIINYYNSLFK
jgi:hypothetical protein